MNTPILQQLSLFSNEPNTVTIQLTQGQQTVVSAIDADLAQHKWCANIGKTYKERCYLVYHNKTNPHTKTLESIAMHRVILERMLGRKLVSGEIVDHISGDTLDNRRENLRLANASSNSQNARRRKDNTSGYKGVSWDKKNQRWEAYITLNKKRKHIGRFDTPEEAYDAYCAKAKELFGEFFNPG